MSEGGGLSVGGSGNVPEFEGSVGGSGEDGFFVLEEFDAGYLVRMAGKLVHLFEYCGDQSGGEVTKCRLEMRWMDDNILERVLLK